MKILLFGTGDYYNRYKKWFVRQDVLALLDNSEQKHYNVIDGLRVLKPEEGIKLDYDVVVILSFYVEQMKRQLVSLGVDEQKIYHFYGLHELLALEREKLPLHYYLDAKIVIEEKKREKILLMSNDLALGGPSIALFHAAEVLKKHGFATVYASMIDGPLRERLMKADIPVVVDENLQLSTMNETEWVKSFSVIICNTLNYHIFLSERDIKIPVIWWLHDAEFFYDGVDRHVIKKISFENLKTVSVGPVPKAAIKKFLPDLYCEELLYGVSDIGKSDTAAVDGTDKVCKKIRFVTIGFLEDRKGQDILLQATYMLPDNIRHICEFYIVGYNDTLLGNRIKQESLGIAEIILTGSIDRCGIHELLTNADVLICPSKQDPMPTVVAEAMMHSVPCIVSDAVGTAAYIHDGEDGFIFPNKNAYRLAEKIEWCIANEEQLKEIGRKARIIYEMFFSMPVFECNFLKMVNGILESI